MDTPPNATQTSSRQVLTHLWASNTDSANELDAECSPTKTCRNMQDVNFDGYAQAGTDLTTAWREVLTRDGKLGPGSLNELLGSPEPQ